MKKSHWEYILTEFPVLNSTSKGSYKERALASVSILTKLLKEGKKPVLSKSGNRAMNEHFAAQFAVFAMGGAPIYKIAKEFGETLLNVKLDISCKHVPVSDKIICIEFPDSMRFPMGDDKYAHCAYVVASNDANLPRNPNYGNKVPKVFINISVPLYGEDGKPDTKMEMHDFGISFYDNETVEEAYKIADMQSTTHFTNKTFFNFVMNCMVYLNSGDPDLREYRAPKPPKMYEPKHYRKWAKQNDNKSLIDMTLVGFDWKKEIVYGPDKIPVVGHTKWQPYKPDGPGTEWKVKLKFIEPYNRRKRVAGAPIKGVLAE